MSELRPPSSPGVVPQRITPAPQPTIAPRVGPVQPMAPRPVAPLKKDAENEPISLVDEAEGGAPSVSKIKAFGGGGAAREVAKFGRKPNADGHGSCRMRSFHGRMSDEGLQFLDDKINEWLDQHPEIEVKFVTSTIGVFEGKTREAALVLNVWY